MKLRRFLALSVVVGLVAAAPSLAQTSERRASPRASRRLPDGAEKYTPAVLKARGLGRYFVKLEAPSLTTRVNRAGGSMAPSAQRSAFAEVRRSQEAAIRDAEARGGLVVFRYGRLVNAFSARLSGGAAAALARRSDVASVQPVAVAVMHLETSVPFIGAPDVWNLGYTGEGMRVAVVDTGIDYTHADFGGPGTPEAYEANDPDIIEPGSFPTEKVIGGWDFVGGDYDVLDDNPNNDIPVPDPDPLDVDGHGTHTSGICCGNGVEGKVGKGVAPDALLYGIKVWDVGNSSDDVLVAGYEFAIDPNQDGDTSDKVDVLSFSGGVTYGTMNSVEAQAAQAVVDLGTVFVASAGNSGNQPVGGSAYVTGTPSTAPGVVSVAASVDEFVAQTLVVNEPAGVELPDNGIIVHQDWSAEFTEDFIGDVSDAREFDPPADPDGDPSPADRMLCDPIDGEPFAGKIALVFKGSTDEGDCDGSTKVFRAQEAGAVAVILWNGFGGLPFGLGAGEFADEVVIPAVMTSTPDSEVLGDTLSPNAPDEYNTVLVNVTLRADPSPLPGYEDSMTDFTSEGPGRQPGGLKPDISAPGFNIASAEVGSGDASIELSGTSMAAPHVSGVATLLRQIHPDFSPKQIKALLMNQATQDVRNNDLTSPVSATVMGAGRVQALDSAQAGSLAMPGSVSFKFRPAHLRQSITRQFKVVNFDGESHAYTGSTTVRYADFDPGLTTVELSLDGVAFGPTVDFELTPGERRSLFVRLTLDPSVISEAEQLLGWYYVHPNMDGNVVLEQKDLGGSLQDTLTVPWHVAPLAVSNDGLSKSELDLTDGEDTMSLTGGTAPAAGISYADLYLLGAFSDTTTMGEEDIAAIGARSFTGSSIDGTAEGLPTGTDELVGLTWLQFLTNDNEPTEPVEFGIQTYGYHNTTETLEVDVLVDAGADGVFADNGLQADYMIVKQAIQGGIVCVYDLSLPNPFESCTATYFPDYNNYNANLVGLVVDASVVGLTDEAPELSYKVVACTGRFSGDIPAQICDEAGGFDGVTHTARLNAIDPALVIDPLVCQGFWDGGQCSEDDPITVTVGSADAGDNPSILALFANNAPKPRLTVVETTT
jgi:subtilisin family serine protease